MGSGLLRYERYISPPFMRDQNRLLSLFTNFPALPQSSGNHITAFVLSFQRLLGSQGKNEASWEGLSKLKPENGKSAWRDQQLLKWCPMTALKRLEGLHQSIAWEHQTARLQPAVSLKNGGIWLEAGAKAPLGSTNCLQQEPCACKAPLLTWLCQSPGCLPTWVHHLKVILMHTTWTLILSLFYIHLHPLLSPV